MDRHASRVDAEGLRPRGAQPRLGGLAGADLDACLAAVRATGHPDGPFVAAPTETGWWHDW